MTHREFPKKSNGEIYQYYAIQVLTMIHLPREICHRAFFYTLLLTVLLPVSAFAGTPNSAATVLCTIYQWLGAYSNAGGPATGGGLGRIIAVLAVIAIGVAGLFGKVQLPTVLTTIAGICIMIGAQYVVKALGLDPKCDAGGADPAAIFDSPIYHIFKCLMDWFTGPMGKALATLGVISIGVMALYGKVSYQQALMVAASIAMIFGATELILHLGVGGFEEPNDSTADLSGELIKSCDFAKNPLMKAFCILVAWFMGDVGKVLATVAIVVLGTMALYGKVSWPVAMLAALGIGMIFGGTSIVNALGAADFQTCDFRNLAIPDQDDNPLTQVFCHVVAMMKSTTGKALATIAIVIFGLAALLGRVSWQVALVVATGVALLFGAANIVKTISGSAADITCTAGNLATPPPPPRP
jgi:type IV secretory pathway VirB2 component (pilin)